MSDSRTGGQMLVDFFAIKRGETPAIPAPRPKWPETGGHHIVIQGSLRTGNRWLTVHCEHREGCGYGRFADGSLVHFRSREAALAFALPHLREHHLGGRHALSRCQVCRADYANGGRK